MQRVSDGQHIEERVADVGGEDEPLGPELDPGESLTGDERGVPGTG
jgi:hypothetical protein